MRVANCMTRDVHIASPDQTIRDAAITMAGLDAGVLPVGENDRLVGMITDRDIAIRGVAAGQSPTAKVRDAMSDEVLYCYLDEDIDNVLDNMSQIRVRRLPVLDRDKRLVGIVSIGDLAGNGDAEHAGEALGEIARPSMVHSQTV